jgi:hypothetical protein
MQLFRGLSSTDYQDVLRAIGQFLDERGYRNVRLIEHEEGLLVQATPTIDGQTSTTYETLLLTDEAIQRLLENAYQRRADAPTRRLVLTASGLTGLLPADRLPSAASN